MPSFQYDGIEIAYLDEGEGEPVVLIHGFASSKEVNWVQPGWIATLTGAGRRAIALDNRGHGASTRFYDPADYSLDRMAGDTVALMDHLKIERADVLGYSMGGRIAGEIASAHPARTRSAIIAGIGMRLVTRGNDHETIAESLELPREEIRDPRALAFRLFAEATRSDLRALAACMRSPRHTISREAAAAIRVPVLVATGTADDIAGSGPQLAALIPGAHNLDIPDRDHMLAVGDRVFKEGVLEFLSSRP
jgi:pimeloyl-ACP methyl ester carboxylesterase